MKVIEVTNNKLISDFLNLPKSLYKQDPEWVCALDKDIEEIFNPELNANFKGGKACRWILLNEKNKPIGRVAAFYNEKYFLLGEKKNGAMGFFECIDDQNAANLLFDTCKNWLKTFGWSCKFWRERQILGFNGIGV